MAVIKIPINTIDNKKIKQTTTLDGIAYVFEFKFNNRLNKWIMDILTTSNEIIVSGIIMQTNLPLLQNYYHLDIPQGDLFCVDMENENKDAEIDDLGTRVLLMYNEVA